MFAGLQYSCTVAAKPTRESPVVRGGLFPEAANILIAVEDSIENNWGPVISVHVVVAKAGESDERALKRVCVDAHIPNPKMRVTTLGRLLDAGFSVELDTSDGQPDSHHNVVFALPPDLEQAQAFVQCFDDPIPNPAKE